MEQIKAAMRQSEKVRVSVLRFLLAEIKNIEIDQGELDQPAVQKVIARQIKQMKEAIADYQQAGRDELVEQEEEKIAILQQFLPEQLTDEELEELVDEVVAAAEEKNMGQIIGRVMQQVGGRAEGNRVASMVKEKLQK